MNGMKSLVGKRDLKSILSANSWGGAVFWALLLLIGTPACVGPQKSLRSDFADVDIKKPIRLLTSGCEIKKGGVVTCTLEAFHQAGHEVINLGESYQKCMVSYHRMEKLGQVDLMESEWHLRSCNTKLRAWYRNPWLWTGISLVMGATGLAIGLGL